MPCISISRVASVGGSFEGNIGLSEKTPPERCRIAVSGSGTLGHGSGEARFKLEPAEGGTLLTYEGSGEIGGLVAGVGQRVLRGVSKHLVAKFIKAVRTELEAGADRPAGGAQDDSGPRHRRRRQRRRPGSPRRWQPPRRRARRTSPAKSP